MCRLRHMQAEISLKKTPFWHPPERPAKPAT
jgi:hypothetical protein